MSTFIANRCYAHDPPIRTERLFLKFFDASDPTHHSNVFSVFNHPIYLAQWNSQGLDTVEAVDAYSTKAIIPPSVCSKAAPPDRSPVLIYLKTSTDEIGEFVGVSSLFRRVYPKVSGPMIGYHILPEYSGRGYATEATKAMIKFCDEYLGMEEIVVMTDVENTASRRVAENAGGRLSDREHNIISYRKGSQGLLTYVWVF